MFRRLRPVWSEINLDNVAHNMQEIRKIAESKDIIGVVKADAYGHGALEIAPVLLANGASRLAVAVVSEAIELRKGGIECPIMILGFTPPTLTDLLIEYDIEQTVYSYDAAFELSKMAENKNKIARVHIAVDTGMGRIGYKANEKSVEDVLRISKLPNVVIEGLFTHFSSADEKDKEYTLSQMEKYNWFYNCLVENGVKVNIRHVSNSAAITDLPEFHYEAVRPGIMIYGYYPSKDIFKDKIDIKPVMELKTNVVHIKNMEVGEYISYGRKFMCRKNSRIATLPIGYADGYTRLLFGKGKVIINGKFAPVVGRICMDQCMIDITDIEDVEIGDEVILMGESGGLKVTADDIAEAIGTISYEITCMISKRVPRVYIKDGKIVKIRNYV